jgi:hypothetical protein
VVAAISRFAAPRYLKILACVLTLAWINVYICRELFTTEYTGHLNSMQGFWMAIIRLSGSDWFRPTWWQYWDAGMPFEYTYAPLVPGLAAAYSHLAHVPAGMALNSVIGFFYCLGPITLFAMACVLTRSIGYSFAAALAYSLIAPTALIVPDAQFAWSHFWDARRLYLITVWDDGPHVAALALLPVAILFIYQSLQTRKAVYYPWAILSIALVVSASAFGSTMLALTLFCLVAGCFLHDLKRALLLLAALGVVAYCIASPFLPPSLIETIRADANANGNGGWSVASCTALSLTAIGWLVCWHIIHRRGIEPPVRFFVLFAYIATMVPLLALYANRFFLPQPARYKFEMEFALIVAIVFALRPVITKLFRPMLACIVAFLLSLAAEQIVSHRQLAKREIRPADITKTIEYKVAKWVESNLPNQRVMMPGSIALWMNAFTDVSQYSGSSYSTAMNPVQQMGWGAIFSDPDGSVSLLWLKAFGVQAVGISGPHSSEFWKPYADPNRLAALLPLPLWEEDDTRIYRVPQRTPSLAHVIPSGSSVARKPIYSGDVAGLQKYVAVLDDPGLPAAGFDWQGPNRAIIRTTAGARQDISVQVTYHPGWHAQVNGKATPITPDGLGLMLIHPNCSGQCDIDLAYNGGWELQACRWLSLLTLVAMLLICAVPSLRLRVLALMYLRS